MAKVQDPDGESAEFCLDCFNKHTGHATVLIGEALDRVRQNPEHDDTSTLEFIRLHANKAMNELASAEEHVKFAKTEDPEVKRRLDELGNTARVIRDQVRNYLKTAPNPKASNFETVLDKVKNKEQLVRVDLLNKSLTDASSLREKADVLSSEVGCGDCMASEEDLAKVEKALAELSKLPTNNLISKKKEEIPEVMDAEIVAASPAPKKEILMEKEIATMDSSDPLSSLLKSMQLPTIDSLMADMQKNAQMQIVQTGFTRVKTEIESIPSMIINDFVTAFFGSPRKNNRR